MSADEGAPEELDTARQAVDEAAEALAAASRKRVPNPDLTEARRKLQEAEARLEVARRVLVRDASEAAAAGRGKKRTPPS